MLCSAYRRSNRTVLWGYFERSKQMANVEDYDIVVLGSGAAGKLLAWTLGSEGKRVAVIERKYIGGACPNIACLPSKNLVHGAKVASYFHRGEGVGMLTDTWPVSLPGA